MKKTIKKIMALGLGACFAGATLIGASAISLNQYPSPFIQNGKLVGTLVVGDNAAASDVIGVTDLAMRMQYMSSIKLGTDLFDSTKIEGDFYKFEKKSNPLGLYSDLNEIKSTLTSDDLDALKDGTLRGKTTETFSQIIKSAVDAQVVFYTYDDISEDPAFYLKFPANKAAIEYRLNFGHGPRSEIENNKLVDFENEKISVLNKELTITEIENVSSSLKITLMGGAIQDTMEVGQTKTYNINDKEYEVTIMIVSGSDPETAVTKIIVNDEITKALSAGDTYKLLDGTDIGIKEILPTKAGDIIQNLVEFYLGAEKVVLDGANNEMDIGTNTNIEDVNVTISTTSSGNEIGISNIKFVLTPSEDIYVPVESALSDTDIEEDYLDFLQKFNIDYRFNGVREDINTDTVQINRKDDDTLQIEFRNNNDVSYKVPIFYADGANLGLGEEPGKDLYLSSGDLVHEYDYFMVENDEISRVLQLIRIKPNEYIKVKDLGTGDTTEYSIDNLGDIEMSIDGYTYTAEYDNDHIELLDNTDDSDNTADIWTNYGSMITLDNSTTPNIVLTEPEDSLDTFSWNVDITGDIKLSNFIGVTMQSLDSRDNIEQGYSEFGTFFERDTSDDPEWVIVIPEEKLESDVIFSSGSIITKKITTGVADKVIVNKIDVGATVLASEIDGKEKTQNLILVGGPCANEAVNRASDLFPTCDTDSWTFKPGEGLIQMIEQTDGHVALLVAGTTAEDTRRATTIVAESKLLNALADDVMSRLVTKDGVLVELPPKIEIKQQINESINNTE